MFGKKYALRDLDTGESKSFYTGHEAAQWARYRGRVRDETGNTFAAMRDLGYDYHGEKPSGGFIDNLFGLGQQEEPAPVAEEEKTFIDHMFGW